LSIIIVLRAVIVVIVVIIVIVVFEVIVVSLRNCVGLDRKCTSRCAMYRRYEFASIGGKLLGGNVLQSWGRILRMCTSFVQTFVAVRVLHSYTVVFRRYASSLE